MPSSSAHIARLLLVFLVLPLASGCGGRTKTPGAAQVPGNATGTPSGLPAGSATAAPSATPTAGATPIAGASIPVGAWTVVVERYRARVSSPDGINIRSSPELKPDNRTGSLPTGAIVDVEGRLPNGQEAEPGHGTVWYFLGVSGNAPQFVYGAAGNLTPLTASITPPAGTPAVTATPPPPGLPPAPPTLPPGTPRATP